MRTLFYTGFALVCFALNSLLCRLALGGETIDAAGFTTIRIVSGAIALSAICVVFGKKDADAAKGSWLSAFWLFAYAICFSFAYNELTTATGALILFGTVQTTLIIFALLRGERPGVFEWLGLLVAVGGLIYLVSPGLSAPPGFSALLMACAGLGWAFYTLRGKSATDPLADTTGNFLRAVPLAVISALPFISNAHFSKPGILYAVLSGAIASGIGYAVWYAALRFLTTTRAAVLQLAVPPIAAGGGILLLSESVSTRLLIAAALILGGIGAAIFGKKAA